MRERQPKFEFEPGPVDRPQEAKPEVEKPKARAKILRPGDPEWRKVVADELKQNENNKDYSKADALKKREAGPKLPEGQGAKDAERRRRSTITKYSNLLKPKE